MFRFTHYNIESVRKVVLSFLMLLFCKNIFGQLNESDTAKVQIKASISGYRQFGNIDVATLRTRAEFTMKLSKSFVFKTQNNTLYQEFVGRKIDNDINSRNFVYYKPQRKVYPFTMGFFQTNYRLKINLRHFEGLGLTWQMVKTKQTSLKLSGSMLYEETHYSTNRFNDAYYTSSAIIVIWRPNLYISGHHHVGNVFKLHYTAYWQSGISSVVNQRFQIDAGTDLTIWKGLVCTFQGLYFYEQIVPVGTYQRDVILSVGLSYQFKKV